MQLKIFFGVKAAKLHLVIVRSLKLPLSGLMLYHATNFIYATIPPINWLTSAVGIDDG
jgi:hypothetical protein